MSLSAAAGVRVVPFGEGAFLVELGDVVDETLNDAVHALARRLTDAAAARGVLDHALTPVPAYASLLVPFEPRTTDPGELAARLAADAARALEDARAGRLAAGEGGLAGPDGRLVTFPVRYGGEDGPDLAEVATRTGLSEQEVVALHVGATYRVFMLGFAPGFAYLGPLPAALELPRRSEPRVRVPDGSVAIAARQTCVYPFSTPGGWHVIGRTDLRPWDRAADPPNLLRPGDAARFVPA